MSIEVERYNNYAGEGRVRLTVAQRERILTLDEATALRDQLDAALRDPVEIDVDVMFEEPRRVYGGEGMPDVEIESEPNLCPIHGSGREGRCNWCEE